jgi:hypothetical protein
MIKPAEKRRLLKLSPSYEDTISTSFYCAMGNVGI